MELADHSEDDKNDRKDFFVIIIDHALLFKQKMNKNIEEQSKNIDIDTNY